jgi:hypothetical protein
MRSFNEVMKCPAFQQLVESSDIIFGHQMGEAATAVIVRRRSSSNSR